MMFAVQGPSFVMPACMAAEDRDSENAPLESHLVALATANRPTVYTHDCFGLGSASSVPVLRRIVAVFFAFLLLAMQQEARWHALSHVGDWLQRAHETALQLPHDDGPCAICALFAGGATVAPNHSASLPTQVSGAATLQFDSSNLTADAPSFYLSRAPPPLL